MGIRRSFKPTNIVLNGGLTNNTVGWAGVGGTIAIVNDSCELTITSVTASTRIETTANAATIEGHKYYTRGVIKTPKNGTFRVISGAVTGEVSTVANVDTLFSRIGVGAAAQTPIRLYCNPYATLANDDKVYYKFNALIDLTLCLPADILALSDAALKTWCDTNIPQWFNGTLSSGRIGGLR